MNSSVNELRAEAELCIARREFGEAEATLRLALGADPADRAGLSRFLLALALFHLQRWTEAASLLEAIEPVYAQRERLARLLAHARSNAATGVERGMAQVPAPTREALLGPAALALRAPAGLAPMPRGSAGGALARQASRLISLVFGQVAEGLIAWAYRTRERAGVFAFKSWGERRSELLGKMELAGMREELNRRLQSSYEGTLVGGQQAGQIRPAWTRRVRTATGAWNTDDPMEGAAYTEFQSSAIPVRERRSTAADERLPSPREVSRRILARRAGAPRKEIPFLNLIALAWIQAELHDWVSHRPSTADGYRLVPLGEDDPLRRQYGVGSLKVSNTAANPLPQPGKLTYLNEVTHWWDASHIYGSDQATQDRLRTRRGERLPDGKLNMDGDLLPVNAATGVEDSGFTRNWWVGLCVMHTLFARHHNAICDRLRRRYPGWSGDQVFETARLVNAATMAKIHTVEWTPAVLPNRLIVKGMGANWWGLLQASLLPFYRRRLTFALEPAHPVLGGIVGGRRDGHGRPYGLTEEFAEVYRLHAGVPDEIRILPPGAAQPMQVIALDATRGKAARELMRTHGMATLLHSLGHQHMPQLVHNNYPDFMGAMSADGESVIDLGTIDILRARERGVPPYNAFRRMLNLNPIRTFDDLGCEDAVTVQALKELYEDDVERLDLLAGTLCERDRPANFGFGETMFTVFIQMASRRLQADPFYTDKMNARYYTPEGMKMIEEATLKRILLQHYPALAATGLSRLENAFEPWGTTAQSAPDEHPLARSEWY